MSIFYSSLLLKEKLVKLFPHLNFSSYMSKKEKKRKKDTYMREGPKN